MNLFKKIKEKEASAPVTKQSFTKSIVSTALLLVVLTAATTAWITTAWFAQNREVDSDGMKMNVEVNPNLIIAPGDTTLAAFQALRADTANFAVTFSDEALELAPATHAFTWGTSNVTGLLYNTNPSAIDRETGNAADSVNAPAAFADVPVYDAETALHRYFVDYTVRIASADQALPASALNATLSYELAQGAAALLDYQYASSVDFYMLQVNSTNYAQADGIVSSANYKGTLNLPQFDAQVNNASAQRTEVDLIDAAGITEIPLNSAADSDPCCIIVTMRFYYDGGLQKSAGQAYVYSKNLTTADSPTLKVHFNAVDPNA